MRANCINFPNQKKAKIKKNIYLVHVFTLFRISQNVNLINHYKFLLQFLLL